MYLIKKTNFLKHVYLITVAIIALFLGSCKKENLSNTVLNAATLNNSSEETFAAKPQNTVGVNYGAFIGAPPGQNAFNFRIKVADQLGITCIREGIKVPSGSLSTNIVPELNTKYKVVLNFFSSGTGGGNPPVPFRTDLDQYKNDLRAILSTFSVMPVLAVIENEETNLSFYKGSANEYLNQLKAAIEVMNSRRILVTNGGLTNVGLNYLVYKDLVTQGKADSALLFKQQTSVQPDSPRTKKSGAFTDTLLSNYAKSQLNFVNFHTKLLRPADTISLNQVINYLKKRTGKPIISNEIGQFDTSTTTLLSAARLCTRQGFPFFLWYSPDQNAGMRATSLQFPDGTLTPTGIAYRDFLTSQ